MKKLLILGVLVLAAAGCSKTVIITPPDNTQTAPPVTQTPPTNQVYTNGTYGFQFTYPVSMVFVTPSYGNLEDKVVQVSIPQATYPKTNFGDAAVAVSATYAKSLADCLNFSAPENGDGFKTKVSINGVDFYKTSGSGAGAGNLYTSTVYRTFSSGKACIELNETIHTANIGNFDPGTVTEVDKTPIQNQLDAIVQSFAFTNNK